MNSKCFLCISYVSAFIFIPHMGIRNSLSTHFRHSLILFVALRQQAPHTFIYHKKCKNRRRKIFGSGFEVTVSLVYISEYGIYILYIYYTRNIYVCYVKYGSHTGSDWDYTERKS